MYLFIIPIHIEEPYIYTVYMGRKNVLKDQPKSIAESWKIIFAMI